MRSETFRVVVGLMLTWLAGCSTIPSLVAEPPRDVNGNIVAVTGANGPIPVAKNVAVLDIQLNAFSVTWDQAEAERRLELNSADTLQFAALIFSAYKVATGHLHAAKWGAATAGGIGLFESKYQIAVQAAAYRSAATAMRCVYKNVHSLPSDFWDTIYRPNGELISPKAEALVALGSEDSPNAALVGYATLKDLWTTVNSHIVDIDTRLRDQLRDLRIGIPNAQELTQAFGSSGASLQGTDRAAGESTNSLGVSTQSLEDAVLLPKKLDGCVATMGK